MNRLIKGLKEYPEESYNMTIFYKNRSKGPVLIGLEEIVQRQVGVGWVGVDRVEVGSGR